MKKIVSVVLVLVLFFALSFGAFAADGPFSGSVSDFPRFYGSSNSATLNPPIPSGVPVENSQRYGFIIVLPGVLSSSGTISFGSDNFWVSGASTNGFSFRYNMPCFAFYDSDGNIISSVLPSSWLGISGTVYYKGSTLPSVSVPAATRFIVFSTYNLNVLNYDYMYYSGFYYDDVVVSGGGGSGGGSGYDPTLDQDILDGVEAIAQSLLDLETGPFSGTTNVTVDQNGDLVHTVVNTSSLEGLLNALGIAGTDSNFILRGMYNNFGSYFTYYDIQDSTNGTTVTVHGLPEYINQLGSELTQGINYLQRDNLTLYQGIQSIQSSQGSLNTTLQDALYQNNDDSPAQSWSVARWLKEIFDSISGFFTNFWSPAETDLKTAAEGAMQAAADNGQVASASDADDLNDIGQAFSSFASLPGVSAMDAVGVLTDSDYYQFWTQEVEDELSVSVPQTRGAKSSEPEYIDVLSDHLDTLYSIMGVKRDGK